jgi:hypothetical protein
MSILPKIRDEKILYDAYVVKKMSINEISKASLELFGVTVSGGSVYQSLKRMGIETRSIADGVQRAMCQLDVDKSFMDEKTIEWVDGFLLGDGRISCNIVNGAIKGARFSIGVLYKEFAVYAMSGFENYRPSEPKQSGETCEKRPHLYWGSTTLSHPDITKQAERWYRGEGKKTRVPADVRITPASVRLWYLGDGSFHYNPELNNSILRLATCSFLPEDIESILIPKLKAVGIAHCIRTKTKNDIQILPDSTGAFFDFIGRKSPIQCYDYRFDVPDWMFLRKLTDIIPDEKTRWRAMYHVKKGTVEHSQSPGGHYFLFNKEQEAKLLEKMTEHPVREAPDSSLIKLGSLTKKQNEKYNARWIARQKGIAIDGKGFILKESATAIEQEIKDLGNTWAVPSNIIEEEFNKVRMEGFPYYNLTDAEKMVLYTNLLDYEPKKDKNGHIYWDGNGSELASNFHPHMFECKKNDKMSSVEFFNSDEDLKRGLYKILCLYGSVTTSRLREVCRNEDATCRINNFSPRVAKAVIRCLFGNRPGIKVLDPCTGFSGRQFGCAASKIVSEYTGIDLSAKTCEGTRNTAAFLSKAGCSMSSSIIEGDCLNKLMTIPETFDLIFTSPPFAGREEYVGVPMVKDIGVWLESFLKPLLGLCRGRMKDDGYLALYLGESIGKTGKITVSNRLPDFARELAAIAGLVEVDPLLFRIAQTNFSKPESASRLTSIQVWKKAL